MIVTDDKKKKGKSTNNKVIDLKSIKLSPEEILEDYRVAFKSRQASLLGRREVMSGKAKFGIFGDGKEVAQVAMAKAFQNGDFRSGYYRDQTLMFALGIATIQEFFAQLYAHADVEADPFSAGRQMNSHFATRSLNPDGTWKNLTEMYNSSADVSPTGSQMPRLVGLAYASRVYREIEELKKLTQFSNKGNEIAFGIIGNATCAEGMFWEAVNAIGVLRAPAVISIWDDDYGISVSNEHQITKQDISEILKGFQRNSKSESGYEIMRVQGWNYPELVKTYLRAAKLAREDHVPCIIHVVEMTQPQGHSTSGSHERYKSKKRLQWEQDFDCLNKMREWMVEEELAEDDVFEKIEEEDKQEVMGFRDAAWEAFQKPIRDEREHLAGLITEMAKNSNHGDELQEVRRKLMSHPNPLRKYLLPVAREALIVAKDDDSTAKQNLIAWKKEYEETNYERYNTNLYSTSAESAFKIEEIKPTYSEEPESINGFEILNRFFDVALDRDPRVIAFGEDVGQLGGVNQGFKNMQKKHGVLRVSDTGIRECTIMGQAIGMAMRGLRPIAEIQYLDYVLYALQIMSDDLATLQWRTCGGQKAPVIIRTRGHRLEGIWHAGSPMAALTHLCRGMHILVPRDMTRAAGFYNTLLKSDEPGLVVEVLNGYRQKEAVPENMGEFTVPLGVPEVLREGEDVTVVTYGACCRIVMAAADELKKVGVEAEVIDVQSLLPFDLNGMILESLKKTNRIVFVDEDVPGGTTGYMMREVLEKQNGYYWLDSEPRTLPATAHRPPYGSDGDYFSKPNIEQVFETVYDLMHESNPSKYPMFYR